MRRGDAEGSLRTSNLVQLFQFQRSLQNLRVLDPDQQDWSEPVLSFVNNLQF